MDVFDRTTFIADAKKFVDDTKTADMEIADQPTKQKMEKNSKMRLSMTKNRRGHVLRIV